MQKEWSSFRITLILYLVVLLLPFSFYFVSSSFKSIQEDTKIVRQSSWLSSSMGHNVNKKDLNTVLQDISLWADKNSDTKLYIGAQSLKKDLAAIKSCLTTQQKQCYTLSETLAVNIEKMVYLKQKKIINIFYISLVLAMIFALLTIYFVRVYIHTQMKKHAIYDHETKLFNQKYFLTELKTSCARATRHHYPLSIVSILIDNFKTANYNETTKGHILKVVGGIITSLTRTSDVACRYDEDHIFILLTDTEGGNALFLEGRIQEAFRAHDFGTELPLHFNFATAHFNTDETAEAFISRTHSLLHSKL